MRELKRVPVSSLKPDPDQTRKRFDEAEILSLAEGIKKHGIRSADCISAPMN
jgi:ParB-like chromosome segregation protein Spo0J